MSFTLFGKLPLELRRKIWGEAICEPQLVHLYMTFTFVRYHLDCMNHESLRRIHHVNKEARYEAVRLCTEYNFHRVLRYWTADISKDTVFLEGFFESQEYGIGLHAVPRELRAWKRIMFPQQDVENFLLVGHRRNEWSWEVADCFERWNIPPPQRRPHFFGALFFGIDECLTTTNPAAGKWEASDIATDDWLYYEEGNTSGVATALLFNLPRLGGSGRRVKISRARKRTEVSPYVRRDEVCFPRRIVTLLLEQ